MRFSIKRKMFFIALSINILIAGVLAPLSISVDEAAALSGSDFNAGRIIDDGVFYDGSTMTQSKIQEFLNAKVPSCDTNGDKTIYDPTYGDTVTRKVYSERRGVYTPFICLKGYTQTTTSKSADGFCKGHASGSKSSAQIIYEVAQSCGVNPKVLLVLLQKEQSLVTDDWPWPVQYRSATGYGCPDTAPCDEQYYGFFNQVYMAARVFKYYAKYPDSFNHVAGRKNYILYNPNTSCGGTEVFIENQATAGLYNYTPYQPNAAALKNLYGSGDSCSAYGNRNFWRMYNDWFGSPLATPVYSFSIVTQEAYSDSGYTNKLPYELTLAPGQKAYLRIKAKNTGNQVWDSYTRIAASNPQDRASTFSDTSWLSLDRAAIAKEGSVFPGEEGTFEFSITAPYDMKSYKEYFNLVSEGRSWMKDLGLFYPINVSSSDPYYIVSPIHQSAYLDSTYTQPLNMDMLRLAPGEKIYMRIKFQNIGNRDFTKTITRLATTIERDRISLFQDETWSSGNRLTSLVEDNVPPGQIGTFEYILKAPSETAIYQENFGVVAEGIAWADHNKITQKVEVNPEPLDKILSTQRLYPGQSLVSKDGRFKLILQKDGNLVLYSQKRATWATYILRNDIGYLSLQSDGNLVLYTKSNKYIWHTKTFGRGDSRLTVQNDGNLVLYDKHNKPTWHTRTAGVE